MSGRSLVAALACVWLGIAAAGCAGAGDARMAEDGTNGVQGDGVTSAALDAGSGVDATSSAFDAGVPADATPATDAMPPGDAVSPGHGLDPATYHRRADSALAALLLHYWNQSAAYLNADSPSSGTLTGYWTFAQALDAVLDGVQRTGGGHWAGTVATLYDAQNARGWSSNYYDDETWMTLALLRAHDLLGGARYLDRAETLYANVESAWDTSCCGANPGGIWWDAAHTQKATASNAGPVIAGVRLAARTGDSRYLAFAEKVYAFWRAHMVNDTSGQVADHEDTSGTVVWWRFTYNEGLMIGAAVELYRATGDPSYLADAHLFAGFQIAHEVEASSYGNVLFDGTASKCTGDCAQFKGIAVRYLAELYQVDPSRTEYWNVLQASADSIWNQARGTGDLFSADWAGPPPASGSSVLINAESSAAMALEVFAELVGPDPETFTPGAYEAEDGVLHGLGLEASHAGFSGWGYVAGWGAGSEWLDVPVNVPSAGTYHVELDYAAAAGTATRRLQVNGVTAIRAQSFPSTGSWGTWSKVTADVAFPAGASTFSIIYDASSGSSGWLNLDRVVLTP